MNDDYENILWEYSDDRQPETSDLRKIILTNLAVFQLCFSGERKAFCHEYDTN